MVRLAMQLSNGLAQQEKCFVEKSWRRQRGLTTRCWQFTGLIEQPAIVGSN